VPEGEFCNHTVNYCPAHKCLFDLRFLLAMLNSKLSEWYFRLSSTNAHVSHYQLYNLPCPSFREQFASNDRRLLEASITAFEDGDLGSITDSLSSGLRNAPFSPAAYEIIIRAVDQIIEIEVERGVIPRAARSSLDVAAQPYQDLIDELFYAMAGLTREEAEGLEERLSGML
jgi:hypothetical protein